MESDRRDNHGQDENELTAFEGRLATWRPAAGGLDRERMLYDAGRSVARADSRVQAWRLATAAVVLLLIGSSAMIVRQQSLIARDKHLLARELSRRRSLEAALVVQIPSPATPGAVSHRPADATPVEPFAPASYFALVSRQALDMADASWPEAEKPSAEHRPGPGLSKKPPADAPLRPREIERILDL